MAPDAPAPMAIQRIAATAVNRSRVWNAPGANSNPTAAVNTTSDITRGFNSKA